jgi:hypothetical protein
MGPIEFRMQRLTIVTAIPDHAAAGDAGHLSTIDGALINAVIVY